MTISILKSKITKRRIHLPLHCESEDHLDVSRYIGSGLFATKQKTHVKKTDES